jgi:quercetin dioxygenase-like cupin family protein
MKVKTGWSALAAAMTLFCQPSLAQDAYGFFRGENFPAPRPTPAAWLLELHKADELLGSNIAVATFLPNTRLAWHNHPGGQILIITDGVGYYQERGQAKQIVRVGDVVKCAPGVEHWHGAAVESGVTYVAISPAQKGPTVWAQAISEAEYTGPASDRRTAPKSRRSGTATVIELNKADDVFPFDITSVTFAPGSRFDWHQDSGGKILVFTEGSGYYQEKGQPKQLLRKGDVVKSPAGVEHWDGASAEIGATYLAITPAKGSGTKWLGKVTEAQFRAKAVAPAVMPPE